MASHIIVPLDGSPLSEKALAVALSEYPETSITALHVIDPTEPGYSHVSADADPYELPQHGSEQWYQRAEETAEELFAVATEQAEDAGTTLTTATAVGRPGREIVRYAETNDCDHIILGSHGRDRESRNLVGSVAEAVVFRSPVRVTIVK